MGQEALPAVPETPAQQARYDRVIAVATDVLSAGALEAVQMKDLAQRAGLSLATLYRYFPSKDYLLLAVALASYQAALRKVSAEATRGGTVRERVALHLRREFRAQQRSQRLTAAVAAAMNGGGRSYSSIIEAAEHTHAQVVRHGAAGGGGSCWPWCSTSAARRRAAGSRAAIPSPTWRRRSRSAASCSSSPTAW